MIGLAALVAVGCNPYEPTINKDAALWAINIVLADVKNMLGRFDAGEIDVFVNKAVADASRMKEDIHLSGNELRDLARRFATHKTAFVVDSIEQLKRGLQHANFNMLSLSEVNRSSIGHQSASPDASSSMVNARLIACAI